MLRNSTKVRALIFTAFMAVVIVFLLLGTENVNAQPSAKTTTPTKRARVTPTPDIPQEIDVSGAPEDVMAGLLDLNLISGDTEGKLLFKWVPNTFTRVSTAGIKVLTVGSSKKAEKFVTNVKVGWTSAGDNSACGIGFYEVNNTSFGVLVLSNAGSVEMIQLDNGDSVADYSESTDLFTPGEQTDVTLIAESSEMMVYINGQYLTTIEVQPTEGKFTAAVFNPKGNTKLTYCKYSEGWVWSLDE